MTPPRGMREMLYDAGRGIDVETGGAIQFHVDTLGVEGPGISGPVDQVRHNCYLRIPKTGYTHLLFQVTTPFPGPWPAAVGTPEGESFSGIGDEGQLIEAIRKIAQRDRTKEIVLYLLNFAR